MVTGGAIHRNEAPVIHKIWAAEQSNQDASEMNDFRIEDPILIIQKGQGYTQVPSGLGRSLTTRAGIPRASL
jgi:hypothetical protein